MTTSLLPVPHSIKRRLSTPQKRCRPASAAVCMYGVTTVPERADELLPRTLDSLRRAGFDSPLLFVDGKSNVAGATTCRTQIRAPSHWLLSMLELYLRCPTADRYVMFQDDIVCCTGLRAYLESVDVSQERYFNLYSFSKNNLDPQCEPGWYRPEFRGLSAAGLMFSRKGMVTVLSQESILKRLQTTWRRRRCIDGTVAAAMSSAGYVEVVHHPSLIQHTGMVSAMGNPRYSPAKTFPGEGFDATRFMGAACH